MVENIHALTTRSWTWQQATEMVSQLNRTLRGCANYFEISTVFKACQAIDNYAAVRLRGWLRIKHKTGGCLIELGNAHHSSLMQPLSSSTPTRPYTLHCGSAVQDYLVAYT
jgi:hypothetical protein